MRLSLASAVPGRPDLEQRPYACPTHFHHHNEAALRLHDRDRGRGVAGRLWAGESAGPLLPASGVDAGARAAGDVGRDSGRRAGRAASAAHGPARLDGHAYGAVTLAWEDPQDDSIITYTVYRRERDGANYGDGQGAAEFVEVATTEGAATEYEDTSVAAGRRYVYRVVAVNAAGDGPRSSYANVETP